MQKPSGSSVRLPTDFINSALHCLNITLYKQSWVTIIPQPWPRLDTWCPLDSHICFENVWQAMQPFVDSAKFLHSQSLEREWNAADLLKAISIYLILTFSTCICEDLWHGDGSINCCLISHLANRMHLCRASKDSSCRHSFRPWSWLKLCINALIVLKIKSSDHFSMILINGAQSHCQGGVLFLLNDVCPHYAMCWCQCRCCLSTVMVLFSCPKQTSEPGRTHAAKLAWRLAWCA